MRTVQFVTNQLPYLRRYARAITGNQKAGDAAVLGVLQKIAQDKAALDDIGDVRVALYRLLVGLCNGPMGEQPQAVEIPTPLSAGAEKTLAGISPISRQAFLLITMEGFSEQAVAEIMGVSLPELASILEAAQQEISSQVATDVLIIEDEVFIAHDIQQIVKGLGHRVLARARTHKEAIAALNGKRPGLVLADIHLADGSSGIDAANEILETHEVPVVFITAYPERLLTGVRPEPTFLIAKPFSVHEVRGVISQVLFFQSRARSGHTGNGQQKSAIVSSAEMLGAGRPAPSQAPPERLN